MSDDISVTIGKVTELTVISPIIEGREQILRQVLQGIHASEESPIRKISTIYYARWVIIDNGEITVSSVTFPILDPTRRTSKSASRAGDKVRFRVESSIPTKASTRTT